MGREGGDEVNYVVGKGIVQEDLVGSIGRKKGGEGCIV